MSRFWWRLGVTLLWPYTYLVVRMRRVGPNTVPASGPVLVVCNHLSVKDPPLVGMAALPRPVHFMAKAELFRRRVGNVIMRGIGAFPVERGAGDRDAIRYSRQVLADGDALIMFPEGTRSLSGALRPFFSGAGVMALEPGVTVIPAAIWGTQGAFGPVRVIFGDPVDMEDLRAADGPKGVRARQATLRLMEAVCALIPQVGGPPQTVPDGEPSLERY